MGSQPPSIQIEEEKLGFEKRRTKNTEEDRNLIIFGFHCTRLASHLTPTSRSQELESQEINWKFSHLFIHQSH